MKASIVVGSDIEVSPRTLQVQGMFDIPANKRSELRWDVDIPIEGRDWNIGLIVGPSGCGKSTIAKQFFGEQLAKSYTWRPGASILDSFPAELAVKDLVAILSSVGFSSPPAWLRPFHALSNGEQFRATMARVIAENTNAIAVVDEFTSVVDRTVAQIGSCAIAKAIRRRGQKFVAVGCHDDVEEWLQPDWVYRPATQHFEWRSLRQRPAIELELRRVHHSEWQLFKHHHYLSADLNHAAVCFMALWKGRPVAFDAWLPFFGKLKDNRPARREHRIVTLPDFQGVGIGAALVDAIASMWLGLGFRAFTATTHPSKIAACLRSKNWRMTRAPGLTAKGSHTIDKSRASSRLTASFEFCGAPMEESRARTILDARASGTAAGVKREPTRKR